VRIEYRENFLVAKDDERGPLGPAGRACDGAGDVANAVGCEVLSAASASRMRVRA
jgi:hypothetical protein